MNKILKKDLVSIGFMTYNNADCVRRGLESLVMQDYKQKEIIIFDDASTDDTFKICQEYAKKYPFIHLKRNAKNLGCLDNFDNVLACITGEFFLWACPDDVYEPTFLSQCVGEMRTNKEAVIVTPAVKLVMDSTHEIVYIYNGLTDNLPLKQHTLNILQHRDSRGKKIEYYSIIHTLVRSVFLNKIYHKNSIVPCELLFVVSALIWGSIIPLQTVLYTKQNNSIPYKICNPEVHYIRAKIFCRFRGVLCYWWHFIGRKDIPWPQKKKYFWVGVWFLQFEAWPAFRYNMFKGVQHLLTALDRALTGGRLRACLRYLRYGKTQH